MRRLVVTSMMTVLCLTLASAVDFSGGGPFAASPRPDRPPVVFTAHDYGFDGPDRIPAGLTTMRVVNKGQDLHHIQLVKLLQGKTAVDFRAAVTAAPSRLPHWIKLVGGPNAVLPNADAVATMNITEGDYLLICIIPDRNGKPHFALGMLKPLSVRGAKPTLVSEPKPDITIIQADFHFALSQPIPAGSHTIQVMNHGTQPHEVVLLKLDPGASAKDFAAAFEPGASGPPPGKPVGGVVGIESGDHAYFTAQFEPGRYGLICFFEDGTGKPHFTLGMTSEFLVK